MDSIIRNAADFASDERRVLEDALGHRLGDGQQVIIRVLNLEVEPDEQTRERAHRKACAIARQGRATAAASGVAPEEIDETIDEAVEHVRKHPA